MVLCKMLYLLVRDVSGNTTCMLSMKKGSGGQNFRSTFVSHFGKQLKLTQINNFCLFFKGNSIILRQFENFFIPLPAIRYVSYQEMKIIGNNKKCRI